MARDDESNRIRKVSKQYYSDKNNVTTKWLRQYGRISKTGNYQINKSCVIEIFNMLDIVLDNKYNEYVSKALFLGDETENGITTLYFEYEGRGIHFWDPGDRFKPRLHALRMFGLEVPMEIDYLNKKVRNLTVHGNETIITGETHQDEDERPIVLNYENTKNLMLQMANMLVIAGAMDEVYAHPTFDMLRTKEGRELKEGSYRVNLLIGEGGTSYVYRGTQISLNRRVAIKEMKPDKCNQEIFERECNNLQRIRHHNIPQILDVFFENGTYYLVMEYIEGRTLDQYCEKRILSCAEKYRLSIKICELLGFLHNNGNGMIYSDLKAQNLMVDNLGNVFFLDFGIARGIDEKISLGYSDDYAAPEVIETGRSDYRSDIYSLGRLLEFIFYKTPTSDEITGNVNNVIEKCMRYNPNDRYESVNYALDDLRGRTSYYSQLPAQGTVGTTEQIIAMQSPSGIQGNLIIQRIPNTQGIPDQNAMVPVANVNDFTGTLSDRQTVYEKTNEINGGKKKNKKLRIAIASVITITVAMIGVVIWMSMGKKSNVDTSGAVSNHGSTGSRESDDYDKDIKEPYNSDEYTEEKEVTSQCTCFYGKVDVSIQSYSVENSTVVLRIDNRTAGEIRMFKTPVLITEKEELELDSLDNISVIGCKIGADSYREITLKVPEQFMKTGGEIKGTLSTDDDTVDDAEKVYLVALKIE